MSVSRSDPVGKRTGGGRSARVATWVGWVLGACGAGFVAREIAISWTDVYAAVGSARAAWLVAALVLGVGSLVWIGLGWRRALALVGFRSSRREALRWYFVGQLGKYVPGGVWSVVGSAELAAGGGVSRGRAYSGMLLSLGATYLAGILIVAPYAILEVTTGAPLPFVIWLPALIPAGLLAVHPAALRRVVRLVRGVTGATFEVGVPSWGASIRLVLWHVPAWAGIGVSTWCVAVALGGQVTLLPIAAAGILSWVVGFLIVPAPAGLGIREAVFVMVVDSLAGGVAAAVAIVSRLLFMVADVGAAGLVTLMPGGPPRPWRATDPEERVAGRRVDR